ncbi:alpha/beta-hydrolase [Xylariaceae sp. FL0016]|nr:alpha/beta-hydrolase [Xylariaceae sp. FL0016]
MALNDPTEWSTVNLPVPGYGSIDGLCFDGKSTQYLGIPYATIPGRFRRPQPATAPWPEHRWDGTKLGPFCPQPPRDYYPLPSPQRPWLQDPTPSETECLNLNITVPFAPGSPEIEREGLPVFIFIHGGAFTYGTGASPMYDGRVLANISRDDESSPTIIITLNYRLGLFGFLASEQIQSYNRAHGEDGVGNYGIWDQIEALRWIHNNIRAFGGDPDRITLSGQSAGSVSVNLHLLRNEPLFSRAILQSGLVPLCGVMSVDEYQAVYDKTLKALGISSSLCAEERFTRLLDSESTALVTGMVDVFMTPVITLALCNDHVLIPRSMPTYSDFNEFSLPEWCHDVVIGDAKHECIIWNKAYRHLTAAELISRCTEIVGIDAANRILDLYHIKPEMSKVDIFYAIEKLATDGMYLAMNYDAMRAHPRSFAYHFDEPSLYDTDWQGLAHHSFENIFIWSVIRNTLLEKQKAQSRRIAGLWLRFVAGGEPWPRFGSHQQVMIFGPNGQASMRPTSDDADRGYSRWDALRRENLLDDFGRLSDELCINRASIINPNVEPKAMKVSDLDEGIKGRQMTAIGLM